MPRRPISFISITSIVGGLLLLAVPRIEGDDFQGASALLQRLNSAPTPPAVTATGKDDYVHLSKDISLFAKTASSLAPEEAAREWLALYDRGIALRNEPSQMEMSGDMPRAIMEALPGPGSWPELQKLVEARVPGQQPNPWDHALLLMIVHTLNNAENKQWDDLALLIHR